MDPSRRLPRDRTGQIRRALLHAQAPPLLAPDETARQSALESLRALTSFNEDEDMTYSSVYPTSAPTQETPQEPIIVSRAELARLRRLVQLATTTIGELNLWLASAGKPLDEEDR